MVASAFLCFVRRCAAYHVPLRKIYDTRRNYSNISIDIISKIVRVLYDINIIRSETHETTNGCNYYYYYRTTQLLLLLLSVVMLRAA